MHPGSSYESKVQDKLIGDKVILSGEERDHQQAAANMGDETIEAL